MTGPLVTAIGIGAALCSMSSFAPQLAKILREKDASSVSLKMFVLTVTGFSLWIAYGAMLGSWPLVASNAVCLALSAAILAAKWRFSRRGEGSDVRPAREADTELSARV